jgi:hypothetical protein
MKVLLYVGYLGLGLLQIAAFAAGLEVWLGIPVGLGFVIAFFIGPIPVVGTVLGMVGAHSAWGWSWLAAFILFFGPLIAGFGLAVLASVLEQ